MDRSFDLNLVADFFISVEVIIALIVLGIGLIAVFLTRPDDSFQNIAIEVVGAGIVGILTALILGVLGMEQNDKLFIKVVAQMGSQNNVVALLGVEELRAQGWLDDGSLKFKLFPDANLENANLQGADLQTTLLLDANLRNANLENADLSGAFLDRADLTGANLMGADLRFTSLLAADLVGAQFNEHTILPDGEFWNPEFNRILPRFTDPAHPEFFDAYDLYRQPGLLPYPLEQFPGDIRIIIEENMLGTLR